MAKTLFAVAGARNEKDYVVFAVGSGSYVFLLE